MEDFMKTPGPGTYKSTEKLGDAPKYGMRPRTAVIMKNGIPGPGQYNPSAVPVKQRPPSAVMGHGSRGEDVHSTKGMPGPGAYLNPQQRKGGPSFSFGTAKAIKKTKEVPGPGTYHLPCTFATVPHYLIPAKASEYEYV